MLHEMPNRETDPKNRQQQSERRKDDRRQQEQRPDEERRRGQRRENIDVLSPQTGDGGRIMPDSLPGKDNLQSQTPENRQGENFQSGTSQAQKGEGQTPKQQSVPEGERKSQDCGESHDPGFGQKSRTNRGGGGKIDITQRDMGQTGQTMGSGSRAHAHSQQQGPYGPPEKHRGPQAPGKPLTDDWGKSDKH